MRHIGRRLAAGAIACGLLSGVSAADSSCPADDSGLTLPAGFCATVFADGIGHARQLVVAANGVLYVNTWSGVYYGDDVPHAGGFLVALQDTGGTGKADLEQRFGETVASGGAGGTGIGIFDGALYAESNDRIVRYQLSGGSSVPTGAPDTIVSALPLGGDHPMHPFAITSDGSLYVDLGSATNSCQLKNRTAGSLGAKPCDELKTRGGVWRYSATKTDQVFSAAERYATGIRNGEGFAVDAAGGHVYVTQHGRDQLHTNFSAVYKPAQEATLPAEELLLLTPGADFGWPECYYDPFKRRLMLAPEYGGDGRKVGICAQKAAPAAVFPAHWAPNAAVFYDRQEFPAHYRNGVFIAFHGSWNRAPYAQHGYNVVFQALHDGKALRRCEIFADGFAGQIKSPKDAAHRPSGLALAPDGAMFVSDDVTGRIYRITYQGGTATPRAVHYTACPNPAAAAGPVVEVAAKPPEGTHPDAGGVDSLPVPPGATREAVQLGSQVYRGQVGGAACSGCHGADATGSALAPNLTDAEWLWSDGSWQGIEETIKNGVAAPKKYRGAMMPMGGAQLTPQQLSAVSAYLWALSHR